MKLKLLSVFDSKSKSWSVPIMLNMTESSIRVWSDVINDPKSKYAQHPEDYTLFEMGTYDLASGSFDIFSAPVSIGVGSQFINRDSRPNVFVPSHLIDDVFNFISSRSKS